MGQGRIIFIEKNATNAIESYHLSDDGVIETTFSFFQGSPEGEKKTYHPKGFVHDTKTNAEWRMQFLWPFKLPFLIIELDKDYSYTVTIDINETIYEDDGSAVEIVPGMMSQVDIIRGSRTILEYMWQPFAKVKDTAFRE